MARYVVMQKEVDVSGAQFIRDGFSVPALIVPHLWLLFHRQWLAATAVISVLALGMLAAWHWQAPSFALGADALISIYVALEGATLRIANLERAGWHEAAVVEADNAEEAEIRYFGALPEKTEAALPQMMSTGSFGRPSSNDFAFPQRG